MGHSQWYQKMQPCFLFTISHHGLRLISGGACGVLWKRGRKDWKPERPERSKIPQENLQNQLTWVQGVPVPGCFLILSAKDGGAPLVHSSISVYLVYAFVDSISLLLPPTLGKQQRSVGIKKSGVSSSLGRVHVGLWPSVGQAAA